MKTQEAVAVDLDDVVGGFNQAYIAHTRKKHGSDMSYERANTFDMGALYGITSKKVIKRVRYFCHNHHSDIQPIEGAQEALRSLSEQFNLHIVTSRCESLRDISLNWLDHHDLNYFVDHHFTNGFGSLFPERKRTKAEVCESIGAQTLIEDAPENAILVAQTDRTVLMPDRPWNQGVQADNIFRVRSWKEIQDHLS